LCKFSFDKISDLVKIQKLWALNSVFQTVDFYIQNRLKFTYRPTCIVVFQKFSEVIAILWNPSKIGEEGSAEEVKKGVMRREREGGEERNGKGKAK
jgi:hypothetical protein